MRFCSDCGKEISLREYDMVEIIDNKTLCRLCAKKMYEEDVLLVD